MPTARNAPSGIVIPPWRWIVQPGHSADLRQRLPRREDLRVEALRLAPVRLALEDQVREDQPGDVVEHQRRDDLVRPEERLQDAGDRRPRRAARTARDDHRRDHERRRAAAPAEVEARRAAGDRAHVHLALGADVEQLHPERRRRGEAGERERHRRDQRLVERAGLEERRVEHAAVRRERRDPRREQHDARDDERDENRAERDRDREPARLLQPALNAEAHAVPSSARAGGGARRRPRPVRVSPWRCRRRP